MLVPPSTLDSFEGALEQWQKIVEIIPEDMLSDALVNVGNIHVGGTGAYRSDLAFSIIFLCVILLLNISEKERLRQFDEAMESYEQALMRKPDSVKILNVMCRLDLMEVQTP